MALKCHKTSLRRCGACPTRKLQPVRAELISRGRALLPKSLTVDRNMLGEGSFGQVFMGSWRSATGDTKVVLKRVKAKVEGALAMGQMELLLNAYAGKVAKAHCAEFLGYCEVAAEEATSRLTSGLWLVWKYEGSRTLAYYLRRRDTLRALASDMEIPEEAVVATAIKQLCEGLAAFHAAGLVHRDVKPQNIIFADDVKRLKLIDLGACADLRTGTNYVPDESILDPNYCPPEQYVLPTDSPHLAKSMLRLAISPMLWAQHKPDRFDTWSAGVCMLQLAVPSMRQDRCLRNFNTIFSTKCSYDLAVWRTMSYIPAREFEVLDAEDGAGWDLVRMLLRPRSIKTLQDGTVVFVNDNSQQRLSAGEALRHRFMKQAAEPGSIFIESGATSSGSYSGSSSSSGSGPAQRSTGARGLRVPPAAAAAAAGSSGQSSSGSGGSNAARRGSAGRQSTAAGSGQKSQGQGQGTAATGAGSQSGSFEAAVGLWRNLTGKLFDLEANIVMTASATELQTGLVKQLKKKVVKGQASADALRQEEVKLSGMEQQLGTLQDDFNKTASAVGNVLSFLGFGGQSQGSAPAGATGPRSSSSGSSGSSGSKQALADSSQAGRVSKPPSTPTKLAPQPPPKSGAGGLWASVQDRMSSLEQQFSNQVAATERQSFEVRRLKQELSRGLVEEAAVARAEELLQRMERRLSKLDQDVATQRQTTPGFFSMFGSFGATPPAEAPPPAAAPAPEPARQGAPSSSPAATAASSAPAPAAAGSKPTAPTGFGGLLSRMFGGGRSGNQKTNAVSATAPAASVIPEQQQQQQQLLGGVQRAAAAPRGRTAPVPVRGAFVEVIAAQTNNPVVAAAQAGAGQAMVQGAGSLLATSLKFTGLAAKVALGMASSLKADAERMMKQMEAEAAAQRQRKALEQAFMRMLRTKQPPMSSTTSFTEVERQFGQDARFLAVASEERRLLVAAYVDALLQAELRQAAASEAKLRERMMETLSPESSWEDVQLLLAQDPAFKAVSDPQVRQGLFEEVLQCLRDDEQGAVLTARNEQAFQEMLEDLDSPAIGPDTAWPLIKPQVWKDSRYLAVPESRRRSLFATVQAARAAEAAALAQAQRAQAEAQAQSLAALLRESQAAQEQEREKAQAAENSLIEQLRADQTRLRDAYQKMESKLREMEAALQAKERSSGSIITARRPGTTPLPAPRHGPTPRPTALFRVGPTPAVPRDMSQQPAVATPPPGSGLGGADSLPSLTTSSKSPGANSGSSSSTNGQEGPSNASSVTSSASSVTGSNSSSRMTMNNALSTGRLTGESSLTSPASYHQARPLASQPPAAAPGPHFPVQGAGASTVLLQAAPAALAPVAVAAGGVAQASQLAGGQAGRPSELMASLAAAGVSCQRLEDGTLVFSFDRAAVPRTSPSPSPGATAPPPSTH